jgi:hypothetical protein
LYAFAYLSGAACLRFERRRPQPVIVISQSPIAD